jgi:ribonuclease E
MANKMLIDAAHPEETRVVVVRGNRVEEFDFESASRKQLRGNIYLAKVTRVEPSLQAAFVDYGGNRHGFLAFNEIHPDYYQIPVADRQALIAAEEREAREAEERVSASDRRRAAAMGEPLDGDGEPTSAEIEAETEAEIAAEADALTGGESQAMVEAEAEIAAEGGALSEAVHSEGGEAAPESAGGAQGERGMMGSAMDLAETAAPDGGANGAAHEAGTAIGPTGGETVEVESDESVESVGAVDALEELPERRQRTRMRQYKIQEVIKRRQVLLVQVVKEERGNKGAALTTYLSLAGRYSVLMPNTARGGGISRKITSITDRKRLKQVVSDLSVPRGMGVILRTAGASRTRAEVKRDFEYLLRLWETVRELTLQSTAPALVYEEGSLIKRSIRDLYNKDIDEVIVAGDDAYREAKEFMRMLMPSHAKNVKVYKDTQPIFARHGIEAQLDAMFSPQVTLASGGYSVINQTEALVAIDVNSGRSTREHSIEDTALQTNLEAAEEVARQLRLRDLAGLIVIDFIDMEEKRNNRAVERRLKEALKNDRARIQVGRISHFGLLEMSRQRIRTGVVESVSSPCPTCLGTGHVRSPSSVALHVLRALEDQLPKGATHNLTIRTRTNVALYMLNQKREHLSEIERRFGISITVLADDLIPAGQHFAIERGEPAERREVAVITTVQPDSIAPRDVVEESPATDMADADAAEAEHDEVEAGAEREEREEHGERAEGGRRDRGEREGGRRRRRRRGRGSNRDGGNDQQRAADGHREPNGEARPESGPPAVVADAEGEAGEEAFEGERSAGQPQDDGEPRRRRRGRRGGRRGRRGRGDRIEQGGSEPGGDRLPENRDASYRFGDEIGLLEIDTTPQPEPRRDARLTETPLRPTIAHDEDALVPAEPPRPRDQETPRGETLGQAEPSTASEPPAPAQPPAEEEDDDPNRPKRTGWWTRRSFF